MRPALRTLCWSELWPHIQDRLADRPDAAHLSHLFAVEPGHANYAAGPFDVPGPLPDGWHSLILESHTWPLVDATMDVVIGCHVAEMAGAADFLAEASRILKVGGLLVLRDRIVPGSRRRGRAARQQQAAGDYLNALARLHDWRHQGFVTLEQWLALLLEHNFRLVSHEVQSHSLDLPGWLAGRDMDAADRVRLEVMLRQAPAEVAEFLQLDWPSGAVVGSSAGQRHFQWPELQMIAVRHA